MSTVAQPGDDDLDIDVDGVTLTAVVVQGREVLVHARGGFGGWIDTEGEVFFRQPGGEGEITDLDLRLEYASARQELFDFMIGRLIGWMERATPLRFCGAPGKAFSVIEDWDTWLPLPRRPKPSWNHE